jgi:hypothetical protein
VERIFGVLPVTDRRLKRLNRALLVLKVRKACRVFPVLRDSRALKVRRAHRGRRVQRAILVPRTAGLSRSAGPTRCARTEG